jgi:A/G-specific adenine glycosylase
LARAVVEEHGGVLPSDEEALLALPGVGPYTARAILAFAFDRPVAAPDVNVRRVVQRVCFGLEWPAPAKAAELDVVAAAVAREAPAFELNSALMDLGATVCTARAPKCLVCPLRDICAAAPVDPRALSALASIHARRGPAERIPFQQTTRFLRGRIVERLRALPPRERISLLDLEAELLPLYVPRDGEELEQTVVRLAADGLIEYESGNLSLARNPPRRSSD